jgi:hypothetical protein
MPVVLILKRITDAVKIATLLNILAVQAAWRSGSANDFKVEALPWKAACQEVPALWDTKFIKARNWTLTRVSSIQLHTLRLQVTLQNYLSFDLSLYLSSSLYHSGLITITLLHEEWKLRSSSPCIPVTVTWASRTRNMLLREADSAAVVNSIRTSFPQRSTERS